MKLTWVLRWWQLQLCLLLGGICVFLVLELKRKKENLADLYISDVMISLELSRILSKKPKELLEKFYDLNLISHARGIATQYPNHPGAEYWLWEIREHLTSRKVEIPNDVKEIFDQIPEDRPKPLEVYYNTSFE